MFVSRSMTQNVITAHPGDSISTAQEKMAAHRIRHLPVVEDDNTLVGIVSDRDIRSALPDTVLNLLECNDLELSKIRQLTISDIMTKNPKWTAAVVFYLLYIAGMVVFVTGRGGTPTQAALRGALFGLVCYATYDLTNLATLEGWPILVTVVDLCWGTFLTATTAFAATFLMRVF